MIDPYEGSADNRGISTLDKEEMFENVRQASAAGLSSTIHAIGDKANHDVLDVYCGRRGVDRRRHARVCAIASSTCNCCTPTIFSGWRS